MPLTDSDLLLLEQLLHEENIDSLFKGLTEFDDKTNPNYKLLFECLQNQEFDFKGDLISGYGGAILEGSSRCFSKDQKVVTKKGLKKISDIKKGDFVKSFNEDKKENEYKKVLNVFKLKNKKKCFRIKLKNGKTIECTSDHKFYYKGKFIEIEKILNLL